jgi:hypothetical protein
MSTRKTTVIWTIVVFGILAAVSTAILVYRRLPVVLRGAVLQADSDPNKQLPLADVEITAIGSSSHASSKSNPAGFFRLTLPKGLHSHQPVTLQFRRKDYEPLDLNDFIGDKVYVVRMVPIHQDVNSASHPESAVSNTRRRYSLKTTT